MDLIVKPSEAAELLHGKGCSKAKANVIRRQCADGVIRNAEKVGSVWYINATREWPQLFSEVDPASAIKESAEPKPTITADTTIGELFQLLAKVARGGEACTSL